MIFGGERDHQLTQPDLRKAEAGAASPETSQADSTPYVAGELSEGRSAAAAATAAVRTKPLPALSHLTYRNIA